MALCMFLFSFIMFPLVVVRHMDVKILDVESIFVLPSQISCVLDGLLIMNDDHVFLS